MNTEELKRLAESVINADNAGDAIEAVMEFMKAAGPQEILALIRQRDELLEALKDAREMVSDWAGYASPYFQEKNDIDGDLKKLDDAIAKAEG